MQQVSHILICIVDSILIQLIFIRSPPPPPPPHQIEKESIAIAESIINSENNANILAVIGAGRSANSAAIQKVLAPQTIAQISYASTAASLSNRQEFPTFFRLVPPDAAQMHGLLRICLDQNWKKVSIIMWTGDSYSESLTERFQLLAGYEDLKIANVIKIPRSDKEKEQSRVREAMRTIKREEKIFLLLGLASDAIDVLAAAKEFDLLDGERTFLATDAVMNSSLLSSLDANRQSALGIVGLRLSPGNTDAYDEFVFRWRAKNDSEAFPGSQSTRTNPEPVPNLFASYTYDCVFALALAISQSGKTPDRDTVLKFLRDVQFEGATGSVAFDDNFDRIGTTFDVFNFRSNNATGEVELQKIGTFEDRGQKDIGPIEYEINPVFSIEEVSSIAVDNHPTAAQSDSSPAVEFESQSMTIQPNVINFILLATASFFF